MIDTAIPAPPKWFTDALAVERQKTATRAAVAELPRLEADLAINGRHRRGRTARRSHRGRGSRPGAAAAGTDR